MNYIKKNRKNVLIISLLAVLVLAVGFSFDNNGTNTINKQMVDETSETNNDETKDLFQIANAEADDLRSKRVVEDNKVVVEEQEEVEEKVQDEVKEITLTKDEVVQKVMNGSFGNSSERKQNVEKHGFDYGEIQSVINERHKVEQEKLAKQAPVSNQVVETTTTSTNTSTSSQPTHTETPQYKENHIYVAGTSMPMTVTSFDNLQGTIDSTTYTWVGYESYNPHDNKGTYLAQHNNTGGGVVLGLSNGQQVIATDSSGTPHTYSVSKVLYNQETFTDEIRGSLNKEYLVLQTSEKRVNGSRVGNRIVIADK